MAEELDMENRDPNNLNSFLGVTFEDVIGEPTGAHSADCVWKNSYKCYTCGKDLCYLILTYLCGIFAALYWGCLFACIAFDHIWCITPACKAYAIQLSCVKVLVESCMNACYAPLCSTYALFFSKIVVTQKSG